MKTESGWWDGAVPVTLGSRFTVYRVNNNHQAADILLNRWPTKGGAKHRAARAAVLAAMERTKDRMALAKAQKAFAEAAKEADILIE
jgi:hypothetical protein